MNALRKIGFVLVSFVGIRIFMGLLFALGLVSNHVSSLVSFIILFIVFMFAKKVLAILLFYLSGLSGDYKFATKTFIVLGVLELVYAVYIFFTSDLFKGKFDMDLITFVVLFFTGLNALYKGIAFAHFTREEGKTKIDFSDLPK